MVTRTVRYFVAMCLGVLLMADFGTAAGRDPDKNKDNANVRGESGEVNAAQAIQDWPSTARQAAQDLIQKYGEPDGVTPDHLMWMNKGNFHEISVYKEQVEHNFPTRHMDVVKHTVFMRVPPDKLDDLAEFDGSIEVNRTRGTISSFCDSEQHNIVALNLAAEIVNNQRSVQEARQTFAGLTATTGTMSTRDADRGYIEALRFNITGANTVRDPGQSWTGGTGTGTGTTGTGIGTGGTGTGTGTGMGTGTGRGTGTGIGTGRGTGTFDTLGTDTSMNRTGTRTGTRTGRGMTRDTSRDTSDTGRDTTGTMNRGTGTTPR